MTDHKKKKKTPKTIDDLMAQKLLDRRRKRNRSGTK